MKWRRVVFILASIVVSALSVAVALRSVDVGEVWASIREAKSLWVVMTIVAIFVALYTRGIRWRGLVEDKISTNRAYYIFSIAMLLNLLPFRLGEVARSVLATREDIPFVTAATSIVVERLLDLVMVLVLLLVCVALLPVVPTWVARPATLFAIAAVVGFAVLILLARYRTTAHNMRGWFQNRLKFLQRLPLEKLLDNLLDGLTPLIQPRRLVHAVVWTVIGWSVSLISFYFSALALGIVESPFLLSGLSIALASFTVAIPVSVGAIGPFEAAIREAANIIGIETTLAAALGFLFHGLTIVGYVGSGILGFVLLGVGLLDVVNNPKPESAESDA